jgi:hypothetical protein
MISDVEVIKLLKLKDGYLFRREGQELEYKEQFNFSGLADYFKDFAAFANNRGGLLVFGVQDSPRLPIGLTDASLKMFNNIETEKITGYLLDIFSGDIYWELGVFEVEGKTYAIFQISEARVKPIIAKKDEGRDQIIKNGEIYYRYGGRTQKIQYAELQNIINLRVEQNNQQWLDLMSKIGKAGPQNAAILDTERALIEKDDSKILVLDEELSHKIKFIKEGEFSEQKGAITLKLIGDIVPIDRVEVVRKISEELTKEYPLSALELVEEVKKSVPNSNRRNIWEIIKENELKSNKNYAAYVFRNKTLEDKFKTSKKLPGGTPSIYKQNAVDFIVKILKTPLPL